MDSKRQQMKQELMKKVSDRLDEVLESPTVTMSDIENVVAVFQRDMGREVAEGVLALKKTKRKNI